MQITLNLKLLCDDALVHVAKGLLEECKVDRQHAVIAEQRSMMFKAAVNQLERRGVDGTRVANQLRRAFNQSPVAAFLASKAVVE